jgi:hypothetical protein
MAPKKTSSKKGKSTGFVIGSVRFRKISAVEGIVYSPKMKGSAAIGKSAKALTREERRKAIIKAYRKAWSGMYDAVVDDYCYPGTTVLKNKLDLREAEELESFEAEVSDARADEELPAGDLDFTHFKGIRHRRGRCARLQTIDGNRPPN